jgi:glutathione reductase (NADPH)
LVATGGTPTVPDFPGRELVVTSDSMFDLDLPRRLVVVGAGYIACEFASIFQGLGAHVTQIHRGDQVLRGFDEDVRHFIAHEMRKHGVDLRLRCTVRSVTREHGALIVTLADGERLAADTVLYATGRAPNTEGLCLEMAGVQQDEQGSIRVDAHYRSSVPSIHAVGDVCTRFQLTPVALAEAMVVVDRLFGEGQRALAYDFIPTAVFTHPNIGTVGLTEAQARERHPEIDVYRTDFRPLKHTLSGSTERTFMKLVVDRASDRVVGLHMVGAEAGEIVQGFAVALKAGATKALFDATIGIHPTAAEEFVTMREPLAGAARGWMPPDAA